MIAVSSFSRMMLTMAILWACRTACPENLEVPGTGRWETMLFPSAEVDRVAKKKYADILEDYVAHRQLDSNKELKRRVRKIGATLVMAAISFKPSVCTWDWEFHTTTDINVDAFSMAGGKIMVGSAFVDKLKLNDGELATLIAHEMAHAVAEHQREELSEARQIQGRATTAEILTETLGMDIGLQIRLYDVSIQQETEADELGMLMAHKAGWSGRDMVSFFEKLAASESDTMHSSGYPSMSSRVSMARGMARLFAGERQHSVANVTPDH
jgi:predicted Zn-dependent protease